MRFTTTPTEPPSISRWMRNVWDAVTTTVIGMSITIRYFFTKPVTYEYPEQQMPVAPRYRGLHYLEQDICIACRVCEKACPIDCIEIRFVRHPGNVNEWFEFSLDYNKCMFCELCCYPCPVDCIHMGREYSLVKYDRNELVMDLLTWEGMRPKDEQTIQNAIEEKKRKAAEAAAKRAAQKKAQAEKAKVEPKTEKPKPEPKVEKAKPEPKTEKPEPEPRTEKPEPEKAKAEPEPEQPKAEPKPQQPKPEKAAAKARAEPAKVRKPKADADEVRSETDVPAENPANKPADGGGKEKDKDGG